jgi:hypothetical protein
VAQAYARSLCTIIVIYMCVDTLIYKISEISIHKVTDDPSIPNTAIMVSE